MVCRSDANLTHSLTTACRGRPGLATIVDSANNGIYSQLSDITLMNFDSVH